MKLAKAAVRGGMWRARERVAGGGNAMWRERVEVVVVMWREMVVAGVEM